MNNEFDELTKGMAQSVTRRAALRKLGIGLAGMAMACFGLANKAEARGGGCLPGGSHCKNDNQCCSTRCSNGTCSCQPTGAGCAFDWVCCSGICGPGLPGRPGRCA